MKKKNAFLVFLFASFFLLVVGAASQLMPSPQSLLAIDCGSFTSQSVCTSYTECKWDTTHNSCYYSTSTTNTTCGSGYYWDSMTSMCKVDCGYYKDTTSCSGKTECKWDTASNWCMFATSAASSCGSGYYWDSMTSMCKVDCGYYKDTTSCSGKTECKWDTASNWCMSTTSSTGSCGSGYYWDSMTSMCKVSCGSITTQSSCASYAECKWDATYNGCVFAISPVMTCGDGFILDPATNYCVSASAARVTGMVSDSSGSPIKEAFINVRKSDWSMSWGASSNSEGKYTVFNIEPGTYLVELMPPYNSSGLLSPAPESVTLTQGQVVTKNFSFLKATKTILGTVKKSDGSVVKDAMVNAWQKDTSKYFGKEADSNGAYSVSVGGGLWEVSVFPKSGISDWTFNEQPKSVIFANNETVEKIVIDFVVRATDARVKGKVLKPDGSAPRADTVFVDLYSQTMGMGFGGPVDASGSFEIAVSAGSYDVHVFSNDTSFSGPHVNPVTVNKGETKDLGTITLQKANKTLKGTVTFQDGKVVSDARVGAYKKDTQQWLDAKVDSFGSYILQLTGGSWEISVHPDSMSPDWAYNKPPEVVTFLDDTSQETKSLNFTVIVADAKIKGKIIKPDGSIPREKTVFVNVWSSSSGLGSGGPVMADGSFSISIPAGTYNMDIHSDDPSLSTPPTSPISVSKGETKDLGTITLITKSDHIKGKVTDKSGKGLSNIRVDAWIREGAGYSTTITDGNGNYDLLVTPGKWEANAMPQDPSVSFYNPDPPKGVEVKAGVVSIIDFVLLVADSGISGNVTDPSGSILSDLYGFVQLSRTSISSQFTEEGGFDFGFGPGIGGQIERGKFSFKAPAGTYNVQVFLPPDSPYTSGDPQTVTLTSGQTLSVNVKVLLNNSKITGNIKDAKGNLVTGVDIFVFGTSKSGVWQEAAVDRSTGKYTLKVSAGTWYVGYHVDPASGYLSGEENKVEVIVSEGQTVTKDLVVEKAGSKITGQVRDSLGKGVSYVFIDVSKTSFAGIDFSTKPEQISFVAGGMTDASGFYTMNVPAGTFFVNVFIPPHLGFISPKEQSITVLDGETKTLNLEVRSADLKISGKVSADGAAIKDAFVWAWSENGGYREALTKSDGYYELAVAASTAWHMGAGAPINNEFYRSDEVVIKVGDTNVTHDITLQKIGKLGESVTKTFEAAEATVVQSQEGVSVVAPASSFSISGSVTITVTPDTRVASQGGGTNVFGLAYELEARQADGTVVTNFNSDVTVSLPYIEDDLAAFGAKEDDLSLAFWDETVAAWKNVDTAIVNKEQNIVTGSVDHFTRFAIVSAADVTPPASPSNPAAAAIGDGKIKLTWVNPDKDFSHAKIYRSLSQGVLGSVRVAEVKAVEYTDSGMLDGTTYYYTIRSVDPAGNESNNTNQVNAKAVGTSVEIAVQTTGLKEGDLIRGPDGIKVYIVNALGYKRHIFNPAVFGMYQHFSWNGIKTVSQTTLDSYKTSDLYRALTDPKIYSLEEVDEANGIAKKHHLEMSAAQYVLEGYEWNQVFIVNNEERDYYQTGAPMTSTK